MRAAILVLIALSGTAAAEPCKDPLVCEKACSARDTHACTVAAEALFDGKHGAPFDPKRSFVLAKTACDANDAYGCSLLGFHYQDGSGVAWSAQLAVAAYDKACRGGSGVGCYNLAGMYGGGHGVDVNKGKYDWYRKRAGVAWRAACDGNEPRWCTNTGFLLETDGDLAGADKAYQRACDRGDQIGCVELARVHFQADKLGADAFIRELDRLCIGGEVIGCGVLASYLAGGGHGVTKDAKRAFGVAKHACEIGDANSCEMVAGAYAAGQVVAQDLAVTERYLQISCDRRRADACLMIAQQRQSKGNVAEATAFARRGCEMNDAEACEILAAIRIGAKADDGIQWAREACRKGRAAPCGPLIERDLELPVPPDVKPKLYRDACTAGIKPACKHVH